MKPEVTTSSKDEYRQQQVMIEIVVAEFNYAAQTAFQANEDRARVSTLYLLSVGSLLAATISSQLPTTDRSATAWAFAFLFGALAASGMLTILQLARLRVAWFESARAMNLLKERCAGVSGRETINHHFPWNSQTLPKRVSFGSLSFLMMYQVVVLTCLMIGSCVVYAGQISGRWWLGQAFAVSILSAFPLVATYVLLVKHQRAE